MVRVALGTTMNSRRQFLRVLSAALAVVSSAMLTSPRADGPAELPTPTMPVFSPELREKFEAIGFDIEKAYACFFFTREAFLSRSASKLSRVIGAEFKIRRDKRPEIVIHGRDAPGLAHFEALLFSDRVLEMVRAQDFSTLIASSNGLAFGRGEIWMQPQCENAECTQMSFATTIFNEYLGQR